MSDIGTSFNCQSVTGNGCGRCMTCRIEYALHLIQQQLEINNAPIERMSVQIERIADNIELIGDYVEDL